MDNSRENFDPNRFSKMKAPESPPALTLEDAFNYFETVRCRFCNEPHIYRYFVGIINEYKFGRVCLRGLIIRISILFEDHQDLLERFKQFLPIGSSWRRYPSAGAAEP